MDSNEPAPARPDPGYVAIHDQAAAELRPKAQVVAAYWKALRDNGMPEYEALDLTREFQDWMLSGVTKKDPPDPDADNEDADTEDTEPD